MKSSILKNNCGLALKPQFKSYRQATRWVFLVALFIFGLFLSGCVATQTGSRPYPSDQGEVGPYPEHSHANERFPKHQHDYLESTRHTHQYDPPPTQRQPQYGQYPRHSHAHERYPTHNHDEIESTYHTHGNDTPPPNRPRLGRYPRHTHANERYPRHRHSSDESTWHTHQNDQGQDQGQRPRYGQFPQHSHNNERYPVHQHDQVESTYHTHRNDAPPQGGYGQYPRHSHEGERYPVHRHGIEESTRHSHQSPPPPLPPVIDLNALKLAKRTKEIIKNHYFDLAYPRYRDNGRKNKAINDWLRNRKRPLPRGLNKNDVLPPRLNRQKLPRELKAKLQLPAPQTRLVIIEGNVVHIHKPSQTVLEIIRNVAHNNERPHPPIIDFKALKLAKGSREIIRNHYFDLAHPNNFNNGKNKKDQVKNWLKGRKRDLPPGIKKKEVLPPRFKRNRIPQELAAKLLQPAPDTDLIIVSGNVIHIHKPTQVVLDIIRHVVYRKDGRHWQDQQ